MGQVTSRPSTHAAHERSARAEGVLGRNGPEVVRGKNLGKCGSTGHECDATWELWQCCWAGHRAGLRPKACEKLAGRGRFPRRGRPPADTLSLHRPKDCWE